MSHPTFPTSHHLFFLDVKAAPEGFHARESCVGKRYVYTVQEGAGTPFTTRWCWTLGRAKQLDLGAMREAAALCVGEHDFSGFAVRSASDPRTPIKRLRRLEVIRQHSFFIRRHTPFSPYVAPRFPHMSEINSLFSR